MIPVDEGPPHLWSEGFGRQEVRSEFEREVVRRAAVVINAALRARGYDSIADAGEGEWIADALARAGLI
jgi:hypothetical protein